jgi:hypothetical protein
MALRVTEYLGRYLAHEIHTVRPQYRVARNPYRYAFSDTLRYCLGFQYLAKADFPINVRAARGISMAQSQLCQFVELRFKGWNVHT